MKIDYDMPLREYQKKKRMALKYLTGESNCNTLKNCESCPLMKGTCYLNCYALEENEPLLAIRIISEIIDKIK